MKKLFLIIPFLMSLVFNANAQESSYKSVMLTLVSRIDTTDDVKGNQQLSNDFARVAEIAKDQWHPYYYAAFCQIMSAFDVKDVSKVDEYCDKASSQLEIADKLSPKNSEIHCLLAMVALARIRVNMSQRGMDGLINAQASLESAESYNKNNPRVYFLLGQQAYNTPEVFGGSKKNALEYFEKAKKLFDEQPLQKESIEVSWGLKTTINKIEECKKVLKEKASKSK